MLDTHDPAADVPDGRLTVADIARIYRVSESTVRYWRYQHVGPRSFKSGRRILYDAADVRAHIRQLYDGDAHGSAQAQG